MRQENNHSEAKIPRISRQGKTSQIVYLSVTLQPGSMAHGTSGGLNRTEIRKRAKAQRTGMKEPQTATRRTGGQIQGRDRK